MQPERGSSDPRHNQTWGGYGENKPCHVCARTIGNNEVQIDVDVGADAAPMLFHQHCYDVWASWAPG